MVLTSEQQQALDEARQVLAQEKDSAAPMDLRRSLLRVALENLVEAVAEGQPQ